jgi:hypothetical protein
LRAFAATAGLAGVGAAAGCDLFGGEDGPTDVSPELEGLLASTVALGDAYDAAIARIPSLADRLGGPRDAHRAHARALAQALGKPEPQPGNGSVEGTDEASVLAALRERESQEMNAAHAACLGGSARLASLLGTIAAARACHSEVLR